MLFIPSATKKNNNVKTVEENKATEVNKAVVTGR